MDKWFIFSKTYQYFSWKKKRKRDEWKLLIRSSVNKYDTKTLYIISVQMGLTFRRQEGRHPLEPCPLLLHSCRKMSKIPRLRWHSQIVAIIVEYCHSMPTHVNHQSHIRPYMPRNPSLIHFLAPEPIPPLEGPSPSNANRETVAPISNAPKRMRATIR